MKHLPRILILKDEKSAFFQYSEQSYSLQALLDVLEDSPQVMYEIQTWENERQLLRCIVIYRSREQFESRLKRFMKAKL